jgi:hypothetical protein
MASSVGAFVPEQQKGPDLRGFRKPGCARRSSEDGERLQNQRHAVKQPVKKNDFWRKYS